MFYYLSSNLVYCTIFHLLNNICLHFVSLNEETRILSTANKLEWSSQTSWVKLFLWERPCIWKRFEYYEIYSFERRFCRITRYLLLLLTLCGRERSSYTWKFFNLGMLWIEHGALIIYSQSSYCSIFIYRTCISFNKRMPCLCGNNAAQFGNVLEILIYLPIIFLRSVQISLLLNQEKSMLHWCMRKLIPSFG